MIDPKLISDIEASLVGTAQSLSTVADLFNVPEDELLNAIGQRAEIDLCAACGWWCESSELELRSDELTCEECRDC